MGIAIIGCGSSGKAIAYQIAKNDYFSMITLIDINMEKANTLAAELQKKYDEITCIPLSIDAGNLNEIKSGLDDISVLINASNPIFNIPLMTACLETNTHYIDLASDPFSYSEVCQGTTLDEQLIFDQDFKRKNLIAVTNAGFSPGFTDVLSKYIAVQYKVECIESLKVYFAEYIEADKLVVSWSPYIFLLESISPPTVYREGNIETLDLHECLRKIEFPKPMGAIDIRPFNGHPELRTIPDFLDIPVKYIEISGGMKLNDMQLNDVIIEALIKQVSKSPILQGDIFKIISSSFENPDTFIEKYRNQSIRDDVGCCIISIEGHRDEGPFSYSATIYHSLKSEINEIPSSISSLFVSFIPSTIAWNIKNGSIKNRGVIGPAALNITPAIIDECKRIGMHIEEKVYETEVC